jgi:nicotinate-nucleotide adenylyltransferase
MANLLITEKMEVPVPGSRERILPEKCIAFCSFALNGGTNIQFSKNKQSVISIIDFMNKKTGLFFGSFNPIHVGHLILAQSMLNEQALNEVWFIVSPQNPLKSKAGLLSEHHRISMVREAIADNPKFKASDIEFHLSQPSYTIHTLLHLKEKYPDKSFYLIMGADNLSNFHKWKNYEEILNNYKVLVYPRIHTQEEVQKIIHPNIVETKAPVMEISSSKIREDIKQGKDIRYLLTEPVFKYLTEMHFYKK